jgi:hypothetical protein
VKETANVAANKKAIAFEVFLVKIEAFIIVSFKLLLFYFVLLVYVFRHCKIRVFFSQLFSFWRFSSQFVWPTKRILAKTQQYRLSFGQNMEKRAENQ